jgi:hypothetical protein
MDGYRVLAWTVIPLGFVQVTEGVIADSWVCCMKNEWAMWGSLYGWAGHRVADHPGYAFARPLSAPSAEPPTPAKGLDEKVPGAPRAPVEIHGRGSAKRTPEGDGLPAPTGTVLTEPQIAALTIGAPPGAGVAALPERCPGCGGTHSGAWSRGRCAWRELPKGGV